MADQHTLAHLSFQTPLERARQMVSQIRDRFHAAPPARILDVGCGNGAQTLALLEAFPHAHAIGVDLSPSSIAAAKTLQSQSPAGQRATFIDGDYLKQNLGTFDLILSDGTLHLIPGQTDALFAKLAGELSPSGSLVFSMPCRCHYNTMLAGVRRVLRLCRGRFASWMILRVAERLHGHQMPRELLEERVGYMYILPVRYADSNLEAMLVNNFQLQKEASLDYRHASPGQFKHSLTVFRKAA